MIPKYLHFFVLVWLKRAETQVSTLVSFMKTETEEKLSTESPPDRSDKKKVLPRRNCIGRIEESRGSEVEKDTQQLEQKKDREFFFPPRMSNSN